ncbi:GNAT family N-acetyltransferase [Ornithinibacillus contaminans]|uniref:GNAT family N-acetyltransferase n=1 Tax=Ornithinibacillus contaminans TaxID=694055 RepID=UPI00064D7506|nr:GNAT family protein [Ornithinibacillus contaminans]
MNEIIKGNRIALKPIEEKDIVTLWNYIYGEENPEWKQWDAPYFPLEKVTLEDYEQAMKKRIEAGLDERRVITVDNEIIGIVSYYWEHKPSNWLEIGIVIYSPNYWNGGYGTEALKLWIDYLFNSLSIHRIGLTTWSGNERMIKVSEKLGMIIEGRIRKSRTYQGTYYDSIKMGMLREEWMDKKASE